MGGIDGIDDGGLVNGVGENDDEQPYPFDVSELLTFVNRAWTDKQFNGENGKPFYYGTLSAERTAQLQNDVNKPLQGKIKLCLEAKEVRHILGGHGNPRTEAARGQSAVTPIDFAIALYAIENGTLVEEKVKASGMTGLRFEIGTPPASYVVEISARGNEFFLKTIYKKI